MNEIKVDVLAVMDRIQRQADTYPFTPVGHVIEHNIGADCFREARAAVAELVEAVRDVYGDDCEQVCETSCPTCRIRRALAKFGGGL